ncbi:MAG: hypothetical protein J6M23_00105 [Bacteroidales bacterium]|nr:hypothetical protein [Bacteroidales bacterium]MBQ9194981.1 hypothetical protein [Bacteroidales bacterium]
MIKKTILLCLTLFTVSIPVGAQAFRHLAIGAGVGSDGIGLEVTTPLTKILELRAGYDVAFGAVGFTYKDLSVPEHPAISGGKTVNVPARISFAPHGGKLLLNLYSGKSSFHFTMGIYMGSSRIFRLNLKDLPDDYNTAGINVDGYLVKAQNNQINASLRATGLGGVGFAVKPYLGVGFGRAFRENKRVSFTGDLGLMYIGRPAVYAPGESLTGRTRQMEINSEHLSQLSRVEKITKWAVVWPVLQFNVYVKLF